MTNHANLDIDVVHDPVTFSHVDVGINVGSESELPKMMKCYVEPLQGIVQPWQGTFGLFVLLQAPNFAVVPLELLIREPAHAILRLQHLVHLQNEALF